jgi:hypothetical protein
MQDWNGGPAFRERSRFAGRRAEGKRSYERKKKKYRKEIREHCRFPTMALA